MSECIKNSISKLIRGRDLTREEMVGVMKEIMDGGATDAQIGSWITALRIKGETADEITGAAQVIRERCIRIDTCGKAVVDTCGTGGDGAGTFNISTTAAFVAAGAGVPIAKHGNRAISSSSGSADLLRALGVNIDVSPSIIEKCIQALNIGFLYAPALHPAMKNAAGPRRETGIRSIFNVLGPLSSPAGAEAQVVGVYEEKLVGTVAESLKKLGLKRALVVYGADGLDEITLTAETFIAELSNGNVSTYTIQPEDFGFERCKLDDLAGGPPEESAGITRKILQGEKGYLRDITIINAAAVIAMGGAVKNICEGVASAEESIDSGRALEKLEGLVRLTNS